MSDTMMTVFVTLLCDVGHNDDSICNFVYKVTNTVIIVSDIKLQSYKYCHHCVRHHITKLQILSSLCPTSHYKVTNTSENQPHGSHYVDILIYFEVGWLIGLIVFR
jgi:hypothetical protein